MEKENALEMLLTGIRQIWWHRPGFETIGDILDTFDALGFETRTGQKPVLAHRHRESYGWHLVFHLPAGISSADIIRKINYFEEQIGGRMFQGTGLRR